MKKYYLLFIPILAINLLSCHSNSNTGSEQVLTPNAQGINSENPNGTTKMDPTDTMGFSAFKAEQQRKYDDSLKQVGANEQRARDGRQSFANAPMPANTGNGVPDSNYNNTNTVNNNAPASNGGYSNGNGNNSTASNNSSSGSYSNQPVVRKKKKGMSNGTKDALIGGGAGALTGALVTKHNRGIGALVGAAAGGGIGYLIGHSKDKKQGN